MCSRSLRLAACSPTSLSHPHPPTHHQARSDFGKTRNFFRKSGSAKVFITEQQLGGGAPQATSPELVAAGVLGPDDDAFEDKKVWDIMKGCDTWATGRMMLELLLLCVKRTHKTSESGLPPLGRAEYKASDIPALPGYSSGLYKVLTGMMAFDPAERLSPQ